jgi:3-hydroxyacyl-[acyl-carrier-protein] dehydratase
MSWVGGFGSAYGAEAMLFAEASGARAGHGGIMRFIMVDEIIELEPGRSIRAVKTFDPAQELFEDHFPGFPVVPGVLLTEAMGQAAAKCIRAEDPSRGWPILGQIRSARFLDWVRPGQRCELAAELKSSQSRLVTARGEVIIESKTVASAELLFTFVPDETFAPGYRDEQLARFLAARGAD